MVTQNPDGYGLPHTSAIVHEKLNLKKSCAVFDISLGCSGFVYGLSIIQSFMQANGMSQGVLVTCDPYSKVVDKNDRNTALLFGDAAAATLLNNTPNWEICHFDFGTDGHQHKCIEVREGRTLYMDGRSVFNLSATEVPESISRALTKNGMEMDDVDLVLLHQGSKFVVDTIAKRIDAVQKTPFVASQYGNTVSSSLPIAISSHAGVEHNTVLISGFGVGLSWASTILKRVAE